MTTYYLVAATNYYEDGRIDWQRPIKGRLETGYHEMGFELICRELGCPSDQGRCFDVKKKTVTPDGTRVAFVIKNGSDKLLMLHTSTRV